MRAQEETLKFYDLYGEMVFRICFIHLKNQQDSYDATQETFLKLLQSDKSFQSDEHAKAWLITVASNVCKNMLKSFWHKNWVGSEEVLLTSREKSNENAHNGEVLEAILQLPQKYKNLVYLHYYEGYSIEEIAGITGKKSSTLRSRLSRAKAMLRDSLKDDL